MDQKPFVPKTATDFQKLRLERLMANPDKPVLMPEPRKEKGINVPEFVRNVMGSSAGAGSGEFHVYRHLRRKEYTRQKIIEAKAEQERLDEEFKQKLEENKRKIEEKAAKKRQKRLKRKEKMKQRKRVKPATDSKQEDTSDSTDSSSEESEKDESQLEHSNQENEESAKDDANSQSDVVSDESNLPCEHSTSKESSS